MANSILPNAPGDTLLFMPAKTKSKKKKTKTRPKAKPAKKKALKAKAPARKPIAAKKRKPAKKKVAAKRRSAPREFPVKRPERRSGGQAGDLQGLSRTEAADSESVAELLEEGNVFEAEVLSGVEEADAGEGEVETHEVPEDDVPGEYLDED